MRKLAFTLVPLLLFVACSEQPTSTPLNEAVAAPSFDFSNGPAEPGNSYIIRSEYGGFAWYFVDPVTELAALVTEDECGAFAEATPVPFQTIFSPGGEDIRMNHEGGWINAAILEPPYDCDDILATGLVQNSWNDNDFNAWRTAHHRANAYGGGIHGRVGDYTVSWDWHAVWGGLTRPDFHGAFTERISVK